MVSVGSLVVPIVVSAVVVFVTSAIIHMLLPYHRSDMRKLETEDEFLEAMRRLNVPPGDYSAPHPGNMQGMKKPEYIEKVTKGPSVLMTVSPGTAPGFGKSLVLWFVYTLVVSLFAGYLAGSALGPGARYVEVFRFVGTSAFMGYSFALVDSSIWYRRSWVTTWKAVFDGLFYGLLTAGVFGWLWPR